MPDETTPRATFRNAFYQVLNAALGKEIEVVKYRPPEGLPPRSIGLHMLSGSSKRPGFARRVAADKSGMMERYRVQIDVYEYDVEQAEIYADKVEQAIIAALHAPFRTVYGIHDIRKLVDTDTGPLEVGAREAHSILDYEGWIVTDKTDQG
jgi:hypothetical protein